MDRGWSSADILQTRGEGVIFCDFVRTSFVDGPQGIFRNSGIAYFKTELITVMLYTQNFSLFLELLKIFTF